MFFRSLLCLALSSLSLSAAAQEAFGKLVAGIEAGFDVSQFTDGIKPRLIPDIQLEVPLGRFSFGVGFGNEIYHKYEYALWTGDIVERVENEKTIPYYVSNIHAFRPSYWTVPIKVDYRFHKCHCVYLHLGMTFDFLDEGPKDYVTFEGAEYREAPLQELRRDQLFKRQTKSYEFGVGFKLHSNDYFRLVARPTYVLSENPEIYTTAPKYISTLRITFGFQYAFIRYD